MPMRPPNQDLHLRGLFESKRIKEAKILSSLEVREDKNQRGKTSYKN